MSVRQVIVCGGFDDIRSRDIRFFEEVGAYGDLYVCIGNDACITRAVISSGDGRLDADCDFRRSSKPAIRLR